MTVLVPRFDSVSDDVLLARVADLVGRNRRVEAELVSHLAEVDRRRLYLREACPSMHVYATSRLHLSDAEAYLRITAARLSRRFPVVLDMLADGRLHLSAIARLAPLLSDDNAEGLLARAAHRSKREVELLVAEIAPQPDVPSRMRRLPVNTAARATVGAVPLVPDRVSCRQVTDGAAPVVDGAVLNATPAAPVIASFAAPMAVTDTPVAAAVMAPLAPSRYKVQFTASAELHDKITRAQALLRHQIPDGDLGAVIDRAMTLLVRDLERARFAATEAPRKSAHEVDPTPTSRRIPDPIKRAVWTRDEEQCTFRDRAGRRCPSRERLEFHHLVPFGKGGDHSPSNVTLRCAAHNAFQADLDFGAGFMAVKRQGSRAGERQAYFGSVASVQVHESTSISPSPRVRLRRFGVTAVHKLRLHTACAPILSRLPEGANTPHNTHGRRAPMPRGLDCDRGSARRPARSTWGVQPLRKPAEDRGACCVQAKLVHSSDPEPLSRTRGPRARR